MSSMPLTEAKARFSEVVRGVRATGESVTVTVDGVPAVEIRPAPASRIARAEVPEFWALMDLIREQLADRDEPFDAVELVAEGRR